MVVSRESVPGFRNGRPHDLRLTTHDLRNRLLCRFRRTPTSAICNHQFGHVSPEAAAGGAIGLVENGDVIDIDIPGRTINVALTDEELAARREVMDAKGDQAWQPLEERPRKVSPALKVYAKMVTSADKGAVRDLSLLD